MDHGIQGNGSSRPRFEAYDVGLQLIRSLRAPVAALTRRDPDLARQLVRAGSSITLNLSEGNQRAGKDRLHLFRVALGSAAEVVASLETAEAWGHLASAEVAAALELADRVRAMLWRLSR